MGYTIFSLSLFRPPHPFSPYHHLLDPAASRPFLLAAGLYGALPPPPPPPPPPPVPAFTPLSTPDSPLSSPSTPVTTSALDLSHLAASNSSARAAAVAVAAVHPFLQLQKAATGTCLLLYVLPPRQIKSTVRLCQRIKNRRRQIQTFDLNNN